MPRNNPTPPKTDGPAHRIASGALSVTLWAREHEGRTFYNIEPQRAFTRDDGKTWEYATQFGRDDAPVIASLLTQAHAWICRKESEAKS